MLHLPLFLMVYTEVSRNCIYPNFKGIYTLINYRVYKFCAASTLIFKGIYARQSITFRVGISASTLISKGIYNP